MAEQHEDVPVATLSVLVNDPKAKKTPPTTLVPQWTSRTVFKLNDTRGETYAIVAFRRKIKKSFSLAAIRYFFDYAKIEQIAWPTTIVYKSKTTWGEPMTMMDDNVRINLATNGHTNMGANPYSDTIESLLEKKDVTLRLTIPLSCRTTRRKCIPPMFKRKHDGLFYIDIDLKLLVNDQDDVEQITEAELPPANRDPPVDNGVKYTMTKSRITNLPIYVNSGVTEPIVDFNTESHDYCTLRRVGPTENPLIVINVSGDNLLAVIAFRGKLTEPNMSIESIREQFDYIKFGLLTWDGPVEPETKEWYEAVRQEDGVTLELIYELNPSGRPVTSDKAFGDIPKLRISYATNIFRVFEGLFKFSVCIVINMPILTSD